MSALHERWVVFVRVDDRTGAVSALADTFSSRGVSFESFNTLVVQDGEGVMAVVFDASERLARVLVRTLGRLAAVRVATLVRADDEEVGAVAVLASGHERRVLTGSFAAVRTQVDEARGSGAALDALVVLPPQRPAGVEPGAFRFGDGR